MLYVITQLRVVLDSRVERGEMRRQRRRARDDSSNDGGGQGGLSATDTQWRHLPLDLVMIIW